MATKTLSFDEMEQYIFKKYCEILERFEPYAGALCPSWWTLEQDVATPHPSSFPKSFFESRCWQVLQWLHNSYINTIENVWGILKNYVDRKNPKNEQELIAYIQDSQHQITLDLEEKFDGLRYKEFGQVLREKRKDFENLVTSLVRRDD